MKNIQLQRSVRRRTTRRVEAGKKLAAISRAAKERKALERSTSEQPHPEDGESADGISCATVIAGVGVLTGLVCLYFTYKQDKRATSVDPGPSQKPVQEPSQPLVSNKLISLDD